MCAAFYIIKKKKKEGRNEGEKKKGRLSGYNLNIINVFNAISFFFLFIYLFLIVILLIFFIENFSSIYI
jgi:Trk-type K+ transport system membrane component